MHSELVYKEEIEPEFRDIKRLKRISKELLELSDPNFEWFHYHPKK